MYASGPIIGTAVNVTLTSYVDTCCIAITVDTAAIPDITSLLDCFGERFQEVLDLAAEPDR